MREKTIRSAMPIYISAAVFALYGWLLPLFDGRHLLMASCLALIAYFVAGKFFRDEVVFVPELLKTGNSDVDAQLKASQDALSGLRAANEAIDAPAVRAQVDRMGRAGGKILEAVVAKPERASQVRRFMNYYLPASAKLLSQYRGLAAEDSPGENVKRAKKNVEDSLDMIASAFEKQLDNLYKDEVLDISTDIAVLEKMMAGDGLIEKENELRGN